LIGDLGLSIFESEARDINDIQGVMPYLAPEVLNGRGSYSQATDVYAFGMIMWEITSGEKPFQEFNHDTELAVQISKGARPQITEDTPQFYQNLMQKCWDSDPAKRPTAEEICDEVWSWYDD